MVAVPLRTGLSCDSLTQGVLHFLWLPCPSAVWQPRIIARGCRAAGTSHAPSSGLVRERFQEAAVEVAAPVALGQAEAIQVHDRRDAHRLHVGAADGRRSAVEARTLHHRFPAPSSILAATPLRLGRRKRGLRWQRSNRRAACLGVGMRRVPTGVSRRPRCRVGCPRRALARPPRSHGSLPIFRSAPRRFALGRETPSCRGSAGAQKELPRCAFVPRTGPSADIPPSLCIGSHLAGAISAAGFRS